MITNRHCAFVTYAARPAAERAVDELQHKRILRVQRCKLMWGKPQEKRAPIEARDPAGTNMLPSGPPPNSMIPPQVRRGVLPLHGPALDKLAAPSLSEGALCSWTLLCIQEPLTRCCMLAGCIIKLLPLHKELRYRFLADKT